MIRENPIEWTGDLNDDCTALWSGLMLRAEEMKKNQWWWAVYDQNGKGEIISSSNDHEYSPRSGLEARENAEQIARQHLAASRGVNVNYKMKTN